MPKIIDYVDRYNKLAQHPQHLDRKRARQLNKLAQWVQTEHDYWRAIENA